MGFYLGIDLGTSYFKAGLFDEKGGLRGLGRQFIDKNTDNGITCELPVSVFWNTLSACVEEAIQNASISPHEIKAVSYSSQTNSFILLDGSDNPLIPLILWPDKRADEIDPRIKMLGQRADFMEKTGLGVSPSLHFSIAKLTWFQIMRPRIWERVKSIMNISDYLTFSLTGQKLADVSTSSLTGLIDATNCQWWDKSLELFDSGSDYFSIPQRTGKYVGSLTNKGAKLTGLVPGISYYLGGLDHHCAAIGSGLLQNENICESTGTVLACVSYSDKYSPKPDMCVAPGLSANHYFQMAFDGNGARSLEWYQKEHAPEFSIPELLEMAERIDNGSSGLIARPSAYQYPNLKGFYNIKPEHQHGHFVRSILESTANSLSNLIEKINEPTFEGGIISTGGGAQSSLWVKIKADILKTVFYIPEYHETACMGAAMISAVGTKEFGNFDEIAENWVKFERTIKPVL